MRPCVVPALQCTQPGGAELVKILSGFLFVVSLWGQHLTPVQFRTLGRTCIPDSDRLTVTALAQTESAFHPYALSLNYPETLARQMGLPPGRVYLKQQPRTKREAEHWAEELEMQGITLSVGLLQVNRQHGYTLDQLLDPCENLKIGWRLFVEKYNRAVQQAGEGQRALRLAMSDYNTGSLRKGFDNGYVQTVLRHAR